MQSLAKLSLVALVLAAVATPGFAQEGGVGVFTGPTLPEGIGRVSLSYRYDRRAHLRRHAKEVDDLLDRRLNKHLMVVGFDYGLLPELTVTALLPVAHNTLRGRDATGVKRSRSAYGLGDAVVLAKYRVFKTDWSQSAFNLSVVAGLETPTGESRERENGVLLPGSVQVGKGSWNGFAAVAATLSIARIRFDGRVVGKHNTKGRGDVDAGDEASAQLTVKYRYWHEKYPGPSASATIGARFTYQGRTKVNGRSQPNSGHQLVFLTPALGFHPIPRLDLNLGADVPIYQRYHGQQLGRDLRLNVAFGVRF